MYSRIRRLSRAIEEPTFNVTCTHNRRHSTPALSIRPPQNRSRRSSTKHPLGLDDLPTEILSLIASYACEQTVIVSRRPGTQTSTEDLNNGIAPHHFTATNSPLDLLLINRTLYPIFFSQLWHKTAFILSLSSSDALIFLKYALSENQRKHLRRIRLTRFMLSWEDGVGSDIWLFETKEEPAFHANLAWKMPDVPRVNNLVTHLSSRHPQLVASC